jgi:hypothetical protein
MWLGVRLGAAFHPGTVPRRSAEYNKGASSPRTGSALCFSTGFLCQEFAAHWIAMGKVV